MSDPLSSWNPGATRDAVLGFVERATDPDTGIPPEERVAVFDNDGTLWCEMPAPIQLGFLLRRMVEMTQADPELSERQPWKAAHDGDLAWFGAALTKHYAGDDTDTGLLTEGVLGAFADISVDDFAQQAESFLRTTSHPTLGRPYLECAYAPMVQLLGYLEASGFTTYIVSGGGRDFMRPVTAEVYGSRANGSSAAHLADLRPRRDRRRDRPAGQWPNTSTTGRRSRCASGTAPAGGRCSPGGTPTATSRCSTGPGIRRCRPCVCSCGTTTPSVSSTTSRVGAGAGARRPRGLDRRERQGRLGDRLLTGRDGHTGCAAIGPHGVFSTLDWRARQTGSSRTSAGR